MERGNAKHGPRQDEALAAELEGQLGPGGSNREEWADPEPPADDDVPARTDLRDSPAAAASPPAAASDAAAPDDPPVGDSADRGGAQDQDEAEMHRLQRDMAIANDWHPGADDRA
jgi:hypothetical protein